MKNGDVVFLSIGLIVTLLTGLTFVTIEKPAAKKKTMVNKHHSLSWSPVIGTIILMISSGFDLAVSGKDKTLELMGINVIEINN
jgi:hypothetical protein